MTAQELKNSILQLAVQGKLVLQNNSDEPAYELLKRIHSEKSRLLQEGKIKREKPLPPILEDEIPFEIPASWMWVRLGNLCSIFNGDSINTEEKHRKYSSNSDGGLSYIATKDVGYNNLIHYDNGVYIPKNNSHFKIAPCHSTLMCMEGGSAGRKIGIVDRDVCFGNKLCCFNPIGIFNKYLFFYLQNPVFHNTFKQQITGIIGGVGTTKLKNMLICVPPFEEQKRIVAKIEELMPLVEKYEHDEKELFELNAEFPERLRKSILQLAVQGKLVPQNKTDEPASELLKRIRTEKERLIKEDIIKRDKPLLPNPEDEIPFEIPSTWRWIHLCDLSYGDITYGIIKLGEEDPHGVKVLRCSDVKSGWIKKDGIRTVTKKLSDEYSRTILKGNEIVINVRGTLGGAALIPSDFAGYNVAREVAVIPISQLLDKKFILCVLLSPMFLSYLENHLRGVAYKGLNIELLSKFYVPIPPLEEQARIVARVEELFSICKDLK